MMATSPTGHDVVIESSCPGHKGPCDYDEDRLYLDLKGALERLRRAQTHVPMHWQSDLQVALDHIKEAGSALCPEVWPRFAQPEYPKEKP